MPGSSLQIAVTGYSKASKRLEKLLGIVQRPSVPAMRCAAWLTDQTVLAFTLQGHPEKWAPLSMMTLFIRAHRKGPKNLTDNVGSDFGRLRGSFFPVMEKGGNVFGSATGVAYAADFQEGGLSKRRDVPISSFMRKRAVGFQHAGKKGSLYLGMVRVRRYIMHLKGGAPIPPRPFFPVGMTELETWGYLQKVREIFRQYFGEQMGAA